MTLPPVIIIHGMWSTPEALGEIRESFEEQGYQVHTPRLPFHTPKTKLSREDKKRLASTSVDDYVNYLVNFVQDLGEAPIIVGHSMGALLSQLVAARIECEKLIIISSAPPAGIFGWRWSVAKTFGHNLFKFPAWNSVTNLLLKNVQYGIAHTQSQQVHQEIIQDATLDSGRVAWQIGMSFLYSNPPTKVDYEKIQCPVLIIGGDEDRITPIHIQRKISTKYPGRSTYREVPGACHWTIGGSHFPQIKQHIFQWLLSEQKKAA